MKAIPASLRPADRGDAVGNLQEALVFFLDKNIIQVPEDERRVLNHLLRNERQQSFYGDGTARTVGVFQQGHKLQPTREIDPPTAGAMNRLLEQLGALSESPEETVSTAEGTVSCPGRAGVGNLRVRIVDRNVGQDMQLAETTTDDRGYFQAWLDVTALHERNKKRADLQARVFKGETFLGASEVRYNAGADETLDVLLPAETAALLSEHETLTEAVAAHYRGTLGDLQESDDRQDITYLANKTGWDARAVALAALADQFSRHPIEATNVPAPASIDPAFYYALFRAGLPANPDTLYQADLPMPQPARGPARNGDAGRKLIGAVSAKDWDALQQQQMHAILATESEVAVFVGQQFQQSANDARSAIQDAQKTGAIRDALNGFPHFARAERQELIKQELELYTLV